jgi:tRNA A37 threonylcarbamoyladenosine dehydratase
MTDYYTKEELKVFLDNTKEEHPVIEELDRLSDRKAVFQTALNEVEEKHQYIIADCIDDVTYKIEMLKQKLEELRA